jgi:hypothetical protein
VDALAKLQELYEQKIATEDKIYQIETLLGIDVGTPVPKLKRRRGPNKPKTTEVPNVDLA